MLEIKNVFSQKELKKAVENIYSLLLMTNSYREARCRNKCRETVLLKITKIDQRKEGPEKWEMKEEQYKTKKIDIENC